MKKKELFDHMIEEYGFTGQLVVMVEELAELIKSITKYMRYNEDGKPTMEIIDEVADVENMLEQLENYFTKTDKDYRKKVNNYKKAKLLRLEGRIKND